MIQLAALRVSNGARKALPEAGELPKRLKVLDWGLNKTLKGDFVVDEESAAVFSANQKALGKDRVALDFEHNTVPGSEEYDRTSEPRAVAGYWSPKVVAGEGIFLEAPDWTPAGKSNALNYEDLSAAPFVSEGRVIGLHSVALTRAGASEFTFFAAGAGSPLGAEIKALSAQALMRRERAGNKNQDKENEDMSDKFLTLATLSAALGLKADAKEEEVVGKLKALSQENGARGDARPPNDARPPTDELVKRLDAIDKKIAAGGVFDSKVLVLAAGDGKEVTAETLIKRLSALEAKQVETLAAAEAGQRAELVAGASRDGKVIPLSAEVLATVPLAALKEMVAKLPGNVVPLHKRGGTKEPAKGADGKELTGYERVRACMKADVVELRASGQLN